MKKILFYFLFPLFIYSDIKVSSFVDHDIKPYQTRNKGHACSFKGLILIGSPEDASPQGYESVHGIMSYQLELPGKIVELKKKIRPLYNAPLNNETISAVKKRVLEYYRDHGYSVLTVSTLNQDITNGVLQLLVTEGKLGQITCQGNHWFKDRYLIDAIQLKPKKPINSEILDQNLYWLNRNPFRQVDAIYAPGREEGTTDIELVCKDRLPFRAYVGVDNVGNDITGNNRLFTGFKWGNVFWTDQRLSYQFATSSDFKRYQAHTLDYEIPLPWWQHLLNVYGGYSHVDAHFRVPTILKTRFRTHGFSLQGSLRYDIPLKPRLNFLHEVIWGFDFKRTNNNLDLGGVPVVSEDNVNLTQFQLGYNLGYTLPAFSLSFEIEGFFSPGRLVSDQTNADYQSLRPFAKNQYIYARTALTFIYKFYKEWTIHNYFRGQVASCNLLPSEEYGLGGCNTVRGYKERVVNGDSAFIWNLELRTPSVSILNSIKGWKKFNDTFQFLLFYDYGLSAIRRPIAGQPKTSYLISAGPGIRYNIIPYLTFRADWGFQLHNLKVGGPYQRLHFSLSIGY